MKDRNITVSLDRDLLQRLDASAQREDRSLSSLIRSLVREGIAARRELTDKIFSSLDALQDLAEEEGLGEDLPVRLALGPPRALIGLDHDDEPGISSATCRMLTTDSPAALGQKAADLVRQLGVGPETDLKTISFSMDADFRSELERLAASQDLPKASLIRSSLRIALLLRETRRQRESGMSGNKN